MHPSSAGYQLSLANTLSATPVVNVASVPQRSPFRYPGGKTWLVPRVRQWLLSLRWKPSVLVEPFAGGAIIGLTVAFEGLAEAVLLVEIDEQVAAVWKTILGDDSEWLVERILSFNLTLDNLGAELASTDSSVRQRAFQAIVKNRPFHGGILPPGSRPLKTG
ncbi:MAG: DNA adenine methylase [Dehalococcoidia bacterium]